MQSILGVAVIIVVGLIYNKILGILMVPSHAIGNLVAGGKEKGTDAEKLRWIVGMFVCIVGQSLIGMLFAAVVVIWSYSVLTGMHLWPLLVWPVSFAVVNVPMFLASSESTAECKEDPTLEKYVQHTAIGLSPWIVLVTFFVFAIQPTVIPMIFPWWRYFFESK